MRRFVCISLSLSIPLLSTGPQASEAFAQAVTGPSQAPIAPPAILAPSGLSSASMLPTLPHWAPAAPRAFRASVGAKASPRAVLASGALAIEGTRGLCGRFSTLGSLFNGSRRARAPAAVEAGFEPAPAQPALLHSPEAGDFEAAAADPGRPLKERLAAVKSIARLGAEGKASLERVASANPEGGAEDYEVHRHALRALVETFGELRSLRPVSREHAGKILRGLEDRKPKALFTDYDDTLADYLQPISPEAGSALKAASEAGSEVFVLTDRLAFPRKKGDATVTDSLEPLTLEQRGALTLLSDRGTRIVFYDARGRPVEARENPVLFTDSEKEAIARASAATAARYGKGTFNGASESLNSFSYSLFLPVGLAKEDILEAAAFMKAELSRLGLDLPVTGRQAKSPENPPYLFLTKIDKSVGMGPVLANRRVFEAVRDLMRRGLSARFAPTAFRLLGLLPANPVAAKDVLCIGDQFFDTHPADMGFVKGAPGSLVISVGGRADPRLDGVFVWPENGKQGALEILSAVGRVPPSEMDKKAVTGLFLQRTASIAAFIVSSIAYPFLAVPVVGWGGYGLLMSFGPLAGIATGTLNGLIADRLSARNAMALNTAIRVVLSLFLPAASFFGALNFSTLLIASFANGWLLSSLMVTESSYTKRLAGAKNVFTVNNLLWINYLVIQVLLGLIAGVGSIVDAWNPTWAFVLNAAVNALVVLPIIWFTMPNLSPTPKTLRSMEARIASLEGKPGSEAEVALLGESAARRERDLLSAVGRHEASIAENSAELSRLAAQAPSGLRARIERFSEMKSLEADNALRAQEAREARSELSREVLSMRERLSEAAGFLKRNAVCALLFAAGVAGYFLWNSTLPMIGALTLWIANTAAFKALWHGKGSEISPRENELASAIAEARKAGLSPDKAVKSEHRAWKNRLLHAMLLLALIAMMMYPLQYLALPKIATIIAGDSAKALVTGRLLGSLFFGNLIANSAKLQLPEVRVPLLGRVRAERFVQLAVAALGMGWVATSLAPGNTPAMLAAAAIIPALIGLARRLTNRAWVKFAGVGFSAIWLPYLAWGTHLLPFLPLQAAMMLSLLSIGMSFGPAYSFLMGYFFGNASKEKSGTMGGVQGSLFNAAVSGGYGLLALAASLMNPAYPSLLALVGAFYLAAGLAFWLAPRRLPGIPDKLLEPRDS